MPRTAIAITSVGVDAAVVEPAGTAVDPTNGHFVEWGGRQQDLLIVLNNTFSASKNFTIKGGDPDLALGGTSDLVIAVPATSKRWLRLSTKRFAQSGVGGDPNYGGALLIDVEAATTGTIAVARLGPA